MCKAMSRAENGTQVIYFHETKDIQKAWKKYRITYRRNMYKNVWLSIEMHTFWNKVNREVGQARTFLISCINKLNL